MSISVDKPDGTDVDSFQNTVPSPTPQGPLENLPQDTPVEDDKGAKLSNLKTPVAKDSDNNVFDIRDPNNPKFIGKYENGKIVLPTPNRSGSLDLNR